MMYDHELMIGDWVRMHYPLDLDLDMRPERILTLAKGGSIDCEPIPLTKQILRKNGLICDGIPEHFKRDEHYLLELTWMDDNKLYWTINGAEYDIMSFDYVHELQHALRLCGIDKEIKL